jgi:arylsulfatase A-like enzyme
MRYLTEILLVTATFFLAILASNATAVGQVSPSQRPNIILMNLDDADSDLLSPETIDQHFPAIAELYRQSTVFTNAHCTTPFCAPSRAALFTGKYGFNNGCKTGSETASTSVGFQGGYQRFKNYGHDRNELGFWMKRSGYRTMHIGKFHHNGFDFQVPAGWDDFSVSLGAKYFGGSRYSNVDRSSPQRYRIGSQDYITVEDRKEAQRALDLHDQQRPDQPFFLYLAPIAPHFPTSPDLTTMAEAKYRFYAEGLLQPRDDPDFDEADMSDKPAFLRRGELTAAEKAALQEAFIYRLRSMKSVDDMVGVLINRLKKSGQWDNTYFMLTSDNGYSLGHHRTVNKKSPYQRDCGVPLIVKSPILVSGRKISHLTAQIDICPTILELAGVPIPSDIDGKSFLPLIDSNNLPSPITWRRSIMLENWADKFMWGQRIPMSYTAERFYDRVHIAWSTGDHEFYYLDSDPFQLNNVYGRFNPNHQDFLNRSLLDFRRHEVAPAITLTSPISGTAVGNVIPLAGYMEDNSAPVMARLVVQSQVSQRYFNGRTWQDDFVAIPVPPSSTTTNINSWKHDLAIFSETKSNFDLIMTKAIPLDDSGITGPMKYTLNSIADNSIFAELNPLINGKTFTGSTQRMVGFHGRYPDQRVDFFIFDTRTLNFFNGQQMQNDFASFTADSLPNRRWSKEVQLPPGNYRCHARAYFNHLYQAKASIAEFEVR